MIVQLFNWKFQQITAIIPEMATNGVRYIHVSPPTLSIDRGGEWWAAYQPLHYFIIEGPLGSKQRFREMCGVANGYGVGIIADCVINHMADPRKAPLRYGDETILRQHPLWPTFAGQYFALPESRKMLFTKEHFFTHQKHKITDYDDRKEVVYGNLGTLPDLDIHHTYVRRIHAEYLKFLIELGVAGIRIDAAKHLPETYVAYIANTFLRIYGTNRPIHPIVLCEIIASETKFTKCIKPYLDTVLSNSNYQNILFYNFPLLHKTKKLLRRRMRVCDYFETYVDGISTFNALQFSCNHDIPYNECFRYLEIKKINQLYFVEMTNILFGHGVGYYFIDQPGSDTLYCYEASKQRRLFELFALSKRIESFPPMECLWNDGKDFWLGIRFREDRKDGVLTIINNTPYTYVLHSNWPSSVFSKLPDHTYDGIGMNKNEVFTIKDGKLMHTIRTIPHTVNVYGMRPTGEDEDEDEIEQFDTIMHRVHRKLIDGVEYIEDSFDQPDRRLEISSNLKELSHQINLLEKELSI